MERLSNAEVMALPYPELVRYCDSLLTEDAAVDILINALNPPHKMPAFVATHCPNGHEYTIENSYFFKHTRYCRACRKARMARFKERHAVSVGIH